MDQTPIVPPPPVPAPNQSAVAHMPPPPAPAPKKKSIIIIVLAVLVLFQGVAPVIFYRTGLYLGGGLLGIFGSLIVPSVVLIAPARTTVYKIFKVILIIQLVLALAFIFFIILAFSRF